MSALPPGKQYIPHQGRAERLRRMRQDWRRTEKFVRAATRNGDTLPGVALGAIMASVETDPERELAVMHLCAAAWRMCDEMKAKGRPVSWPAAVAALLQAFEARASEATPDLLRGTPAPDTNA